MNHMLPSVRVCSSWGKSRDIDEIPLRSRLYDFAPQAPGTLWQECLTSYLNRLGWRHCVSPREMATEVIVAYLSHDYPKVGLASFSRGAGIQINGLGSIAHEWAAILGQLTSRRDLQSLTLSGWLGDLTSRNHLRQVPAWCPTCYAQWAADAVPLYQPLLWMVQVVTLCPRHQRWLEERCPHCQKTQSVIARKTLPGHCTQCNAWLGESPDDLSCTPIDPELIDWQEWVISALDELRKASGTFSWRDFLESVAVCMKQRGGCSQLAALTGFSRDAFYIWLGRKQIHHSQTPSLETMLEVCYACDITPLQMMRSPSALLEAIRSETLPQRRRPSRFNRTPMDRESAHVLLQAVLDGREELMSVRHLAQRLGYHDSLLWHYYPRECALVAKRYQEYGQQRRVEREARVCAEVRQAVLSLYTQGVLPSYHKVRALLSDPNLMRMPEARATWHAVRRELGVDQ